MTLNAVKQRKWLCHFQFATKKNRGLRSGWSSHKFICITWEQCIASTECVHVYAVVAQTLSCCQKTHVSAISWEVNADIVLGLSRSCSRTLSGMRNHSNKCEVLQHVTKWTEVSHSHKKWVKAMWNLSLVTDLVEENYWVMCEPPP